MLKPKFLEALNTYLATEDLKDLKKDITTFFTPKDFKEIIEQNINALGIAMLIILHKEKTQECILDLESLPLCKDFKGIAQIATLYPKLQYKEYCVVESQNPVKIIFVCNPLLPFLKDCYKKYTNREYGLGSFLSIQECWGILDIQTNTRYFALLTPFGAKKIKLHYGVEGISNHLNSICVAI